MGNFSTRLVLLLLVITALAFSNPLTVVYTGNQGVTNGSSYVGPYGVTIDGDPTSAICIDNGVQIPASKTWTAVLVPLPELPEYQQAAFLAELFKTEAKTGWAGIHNAIWQLFGGPVVANAAPWLALSVGKSPTGNWSLLVPTVERASQRMLVETPVPEPGTWLLMLAGFGLIMLSRVPRFGFSRQ